MNWVDENTIAQVQGDGFAVVDRALETRHIDELIGAIQAVRPASHGMRNLFERVPLTRSLITKPVIAAHVEAILGPEAFAVRAILFDKIKGSNWHVGWHQDQAIAIEERVDHPGFGPTSVKDGVPHTRASAEVLSQVLAVRIHLDDCGLNNGPLRCSPGSHTRGRLNPDETIEAKELFGEQVCLVPRGGLLLMRPLCLHASSTAKSPKHRRVIHIEFANCGLPGEMDWYEKQPICPA
ncbi:MAG: phytanoyl-CoA dioxygenase family protein [Phycisphaeraceae bacterium]|nr:phytanoyl-CoA dioxygenase family protein [Phycisphaeraceae bacterium]